MSSETPRLFEAFGVELEYMIVDAATLSVLPITDRVIYDVVGAYVSEIELGEIAWSNELALHVIELKTNGPASSLSGLAAEFQQHVGKVNQRLQPLHARLMPTAMHPWMDPWAELKLWPHEYNPVYEAYNRIFDCRGHGWANLQSVHLNLPFADDAEFGRLHAAIRLLLPLLPALAASSPLMERRLTGIQDNRLEVYRGNSQRVPSITADVIPEPVWSRQAYEEQIFQRMYRDIASLDPAGTLQHEWLNSRGAIARFDRQTIEIRVLDVQECPAADLAICQAIEAVLRALVGEQWTSLADQQTLATGRLAQLLRETIRHADQAVIDQPQYLAQFGIRDPRLEAREFWARLIEASGPLPDEAIPPLQTILAQGPLSRRIERALGGDLQRLPQVYAALCDCLAAGQLFVPDAVV